MSRHLVRPLVRPRLFGVFAAVLCWGLAAPSHAGRDILDQSVTLASEADLMHAVSATLQHALVTTEQFQARTPRLQRFARQELETRRKSLKVLTKRAGAPSGGAGRTRPPPPHPHDKATSAAQATSP